MLNQVDDKLITISDILSTSILGPTHAQHKCEYLCDLDLEIAISHSHIENIYFPETDKIINNSNPQPTPLWYVAY